MPISVLARALTSSPALLRKAAGVQPGRFLPLQKTAITSGGQLVHSRRLADVPVRGPLRRFVTDVAFAPQCTCTYPKT